MTISPDFLTLFQLIFQKKLQAKTGWGRNEVLKAFTEAQLEAVLKFTQREGQ